MTSAECVSSDSEYECLHPASSVSARRSRGRTRQQRASWAPRRTRETAPNRQQPSIRTMKELSQRRTREGRCRRRPAPPRGREGAGARVLCLAALLLLLLLLLLLPPLLLPGILLRPKVGRYVSLVHTHEVVGQGPAPWHLHTRRAGASQHTRCKAQCVWV